MRKNLGRLFTMLFVSSILCLVMLASCDVGVTDEHRFGEWIEEVSATCTTAGTKGHYHCEHCDKDFDAEKQEIADLTINALGHEVNKKEVVSNASCLDDGEYYYSCKRCNAHLNQEGTVITANLTETALGHHMVDVAANAATCTTDGNIAYSYCDRCNEYYIDANEEEISEEDIVVSAHHTLGDVVAYLAPTCTEKGMKAHYYCAACETYLTAEQVETTVAELEIAAKGHTGSDCYFWESNAWTKSQVCTDCNARITTNDETVASVPVNGVMRLPANTTEFSIVYDLSATAINNNDWTELFCTPGGASYIFAGCIKDQKDSDDGAGLHQQFCDMATGLGQNSPLFEKLNSTWLSVLGAGHYTLSFNADKSVRWFKDGELIFYYYKDTVDTNDGSTLSVAELRDIIVTDIVNNGIMCLNGGVSNVKFGAAVDFVEIPFRFVQGGKTSGLNYFYLQEAYTLSDMGYDASCIKYEDNVAYIYESLDRQITMGENILTEPIVFDHPANVGDWWTNHFGEYEFNDGQIYQFEFTDYAEYYDFQNPDAAWASLIVMITTSNPIFKQIGFWPMSGANNSYNCEAARMVMHNFNTSGGLDDIIHGATADATYWYNGTLTVQREGRLVIVNVQFVRRDGNETINRSFVTYLTGNEEVQLSLSGEWCRFNITSIKVGTVNAHTHGYVADYTITDEGHYHMSDCAADNETLQPHEFTFVQKVDPTATDKGYDLYQCVCGKTDKRNFVEPIETHNFDTVLTWDENQHFYACLDDGCDAKQGAENHTFGEAVVKTPATCTTNGERTYTCACGYVKSEVIEKLSQTGEHTLTTEYVYEVDTWYTFEKCGVCGYTTTKTVVNPADLPDTATSYDGLLNESYWTDTVKGKKIDFVMNHGVAEIYGVEASDGFHFIVIQKMNAFAETSENWWENDNFEFRIRPMYDFYDKYNAQLYCSTINGGLSNFTQFYVNKSEEGDLKIVTYELFASYKNAKVNAGPNVEYALHFGTSSGGWVNCGSWRNIGGINGLIYGISENGIDVISNPLLLVNSATGTELLTENIESTCEVWNSGVYSVDVDGSKDWTYKVTLVNKGWFGVPDDPGYWPNFIGNVKAKGTNQDDGWVFRADWWGWGKWNHGADQNNIGDACGVPDGVWYKAFMSDATVVLTISFDATSGVISVFGDYTWNVDNTIKFWTAFQSAPITYRGDMVLSLGADHAYINITSVQKVK